METVLTIIGFIAALIFGAVSLWLAMRNALARSEIKNLQAVRHELAETKLRLQDAEEKSASLKANLEGEQSASRVREEEVKKYRSELLERFENLAIKALDKNNDSFLKLATQNFEKYKAEADKDLQKQQHNFENFFKPAEQTLESLKKHVTELEKKREDAYEKVTKAAIETVSKVEAVSEGLKSNRKETARLVQALRSPKIRGRWGEIQLRNTLELAGMKKYVDFNEQPTITDDGEMKRPDVIIRIPGGGLLAIDAKTPLDAYLAATEAEDEDTRLYHLKEHSRQLLSRAKELGSKEYWKSLEHTPKFVVMFIPIEPSFAAAEENNPNLIEDALKHNVVICTPASLIALLRTIAYEWQQHNLSENAGRILKEATEFHKRMKKYMEHIADVGKKLDQTVKAYNYGVNSFDSRLLPSIRKMESLGVAENSPLEVPETVDVQAKSANNSMEPSIEIMDAVK